MTITVSTSRSKSSDGQYIIENFTWSPRISFINDPKRAIYHKVRKIINELSIHKIGYTLIDIIYFENQISYYYLSNDQLQIPNLIEFKKIEYRPVLGKKTCNKCRNKRQFGQIELCYLKAIQLEKYSFWKCLYWDESEY